MRGRIWSWGIFTPSNFATRRGPGRIIAECWSLSHAIRKQRRFVIGWWTTRIPDPVNPQLLESNKINGSHQNQPTMKTIHLALFIGLAALAISPARAEDDQAVR